MSAMASRTTSLTIVYSTVYTGAYQRKHQSSTSLAFVRGIHRWPVNSPHKGPVTRKMISFNDVIMRHKCVCVGGGGVLWLTIHLLNGPDAASHTPHVGLCKGKAAVTSIIRPLNRIQWNIGWTQTYLYKFNELYSFICSDNHIWSRWDI